MNDIHKNYLFDLGYLLRERALDAKQEFESARGSPNESFYSGRLMAYYEVMSLLIGQAFSFELPIDDLHLEGLDPDRDLLNGGAQNSNHGPGQTSRKSSQ
jgi:hypothetical protein